MTTSSIRLTSPHELLAVVPYLLGFIPANSLVSLRLSNNRLGLAQRLDLPRHGDAHDVGLALMLSLLKEKPEAVILIGYEDNKGESLSALEALTTALNSHSISVHDRIVVRDGRWRSLDCHNPNCCPAEGSPVPKPTEVPGVVAEFVGQGVSPHPDRESLAKQVAPGPQAAAVASLIRSKQEAGQGAPIPRAELFAAWPRILDPDGPVITVEDAALAAMSLLDIEVRDALVAWLCPGTLPLDELGKECLPLLSALERGGWVVGTGQASTGPKSGVPHRLIGLCAMLPDHLAAPALSVLASVTWWLGDGALARVALARAMRCAPAYRLALLLEQMVDLAIRPGR